MIFRENDIVSYINSKKKRIYAKIIDTYIEPFEFKPYGIILDMEDIFSVRLQGNGHYELKHKDDLKIEISARYEKLKRVLNDNR